MIKLSVIIPIYNVSHYLERCVISLMEQTIREGIEYIFIDDCSIDDSARILYEVLSRYPQRTEQVTVLRNTQNEGLGSVRAQGIRQAKGAYITHCDSDDWVEPHAYEAICHAVEQSHSDIIVNDFFLEQETATHTICYPRQSISERLENGHWWMQWSHTVRRSLLSEYDITTIPGINYWEDMDYLMRVYHYAFSISYIHQPLYHYNQQNSDSLSRNHKSLALLPSCRRVIDHLSQFYLAQHSDPPARLLALQQYTRDLYLQASPIDWSSWQKLYPQSWRYLWHDPQFKVAYRLTYTLASWGWLWPFRCYLNLAHRKAR